MFLLTILGLEASRTVSREEPYVLYCMPALWQSRLWSHKSKQNALCGPQSSSELSSWCRIPLWYTGLSSASRISRVILSAYNFNHVSPCCRLRAHIPLISNGGVPPIVIILGGEIIGLELGLGKILRVEPMPQEGAVSRQLATSQKDSCQKHRHITALILVL